MSNKDAERREYFRIDDLAIVSLQKIDGKQSLGELKSKHSSFLLGSTINAIEIENQNLLNNIKRSSPDIARYLESINKKIDLISNHLLESSIESSHQVETAIDLSASGIGVKISGDHSAQDIVMIKLLLLPEKKGIICIGEIKRIKTDNDETILCIDFKEITEADRELIIKHTISKQLQQARKKNHLYD